MTYPYLCGEAECGTLQILTMEEITAHWRSHQ